MMSFQCSNHCLIVFDQLILSFNAILKCKTAEKYHYAHRVVCAYAHDFRIRPGCALIGACALIRTNTVYGKYPSKIFISRTGGSISKKLGMKHRWLKYYNVYINHDPVMTLTYFTARST